MCTKEKTALDPRQQVCELLSVRVERMAFRAVSSGASGSCKRVMATRAGAAPTASTSVAHATDAPAFADAGAFVFDCDGVIWRGEVAVDGASEVLDAIASAGKRAVFVTNNSTKSRDGYLKKFHRLGLSQVQRDDIFSSSYAAAAYLRDSLGFGPSDSKRRKAYVVGEAGITEELELAQIPYLGGSADAGKVPDMSEGGMVEVDENVGAVVVGLDRNISYYKLQYSTLCIRELDASFVATNTDAVTHVTDAQEWAGNGSMVGAIRGSSEVEPTVVGKPNSLMLEQIASQLGLKTSELVMVGDRLDTDVLFAQQNGLRSVLALSGVTTKDTMEQSNIRPDCYCDSIADLLKVQLK